MITKVQFITKKRYLLRKLSELNSLLDTIPKSSPAWFGYYIQDQICFNELLELAQEYRAEWRDYELN
jgi:hypothetical protein